MVRSHSYQLKQIIVLNIYIIFSILLYLALPHMMHFPLGFNAAVDTAQASGSKLTIQIVKTLKQCITDAYLESPWAKVSYISDIEDFNIEMHSPKGKEDQGNWVFEEADEEADEAGQEAGEGEQANPSFVPLLPSDEPLDWGSDLDDGKLCICPFSLLCQVHNLTELCQPLRE
jgi:hypothetical protein